MLSQSRIFLYSAVVLILTSQGESIRWPDTRTLLSLFTPLLGQTRPSIGQTIPSAPPLCGNCLCGRPNSAFRLLGGSQLTAAQFPWMILVFVGANTTNGVLITNRYVLTAATPLQGATVFDVRVALGLDNLCAASVNGFNTSVTNVLIHPAYDAPTLSNDLALLRLSTQVPLTQRIIPICLPRTSRDTYLGLSVTVVSWNVNNTNTVNSTLTCRARQIQQTVANPRDCFQTNVPASTITAEKGCVGSVGAPSLVCPADAGGPIQIRNNQGFYQLIGIVATANNCADGSRGPSLITNIPLFLGWIFQNTRDSCLCSARG